MKLQAPFPYFGGKSKIAPIVWKAFGNVSNYVEPFFGSGAVLLARPEPIKGTETVNDIDGFICNFWRSIRHDKEQTAYYADWPVIENDLHARHAWLVGQKDSLQAKLEGDPDYCDPKIAGWWCWGLACWIGGEFCSGKGPWKVVDGELVRGEDGSGDLQRRLPHVDSESCRGITRQLPHVGSTSFRGVNRGRIELRHSGRGVNQSGITRKLPHVGSESFRGVNRGRIELRHQGRGVNQAGISRQVPLLRDGGMGVTKSTARGGLYDWFDRLSERLRAVRVCCGDWSRVCTNTPTTGQGLTAVFLDPPYADTANRDNTLYRCDSTSVAHDVREWAIANGDNPLFRIVLCGYEGEHEMPESWRVIEWKTNGGYANMGENQGKLNKHKERLWLSPHCLNLNKYAEPKLFD